MSYSFKHCFFVFLLAVLVISFFAPLAKAQTVGIKISPVKVEELVEPGETLVKQLKVANLSNERKTLYAYLKDFKAGDESGRPVLLAPGSEEGPYLASWIDVAAKGFDFGPNEEKVIPFTINIPENADPGGHYGGVYFGTEPPRLRVDSEDKGAGMSISQQAGALVLLHVKGDVVEEARIREFTTDKNFYSTPFNVDFSLRIENRGNVHIKPFGSIKIANMFGQEVANIMINEKGGNVLPDSVRRFDKAVWEGDNGFGRYKAVLGLTYGIPADQGGQGKKSLYGEKTFWIIPWRIVLPLFLGLIFLTSVFLIAVKFYKNRVVKQVMERAGYGSAAAATMRRQPTGQSSAVHTAVIFLIILTIGFLLLTVIYFLFFA
jgi:hypothetical protein